MRTLTAADHNLPFTADASAALRGARGPNELLRNLTTGGTATVLQAMGINCRALAAELPPDEPDASCAQVVRNANQEALLLGHHRVAAVHLLLALLYRDSPATAALLGRHDLSLYDLRQYLHSAPAGARQSGALSRRPLPGLRGVVRPSPVFLVPAGVFAACALLLLNGLPDGLALLITTGFVVSGWVASVCLHEFGHALVAYLGGDREVARKGYLTLNPLRYSHPLLSIGLPILFVLMGGIGLPGGAVYVNLTALRSRRWDAAVSAAGPAATLLFTLALLIPIVAVPGAWWLSHYGLWHALASLILVEVGALLLNLLPIPPLDGFGIVAGLFLSWEARLRAASFGMVGMALVYLLVWQGPLGPVFQSVMTHAAVLLAALSR
jgi:Zn-dependent protease